MNNNSTIFERPDRDYSFTYDEMYQAYQDCLVNKRNTNNALEFSKNALEKLMTLCDEVNDFTYEIGPSITFVVKFPVLREVFAADFRDRVIHHLVMNELMPCFESEFIKNSFSCRVGKGVLYGIDTMYQCIKDCTNNYSQDAWILKLDIKSFFMSIQKQLLADMIDDLIVRKYPENRKKMCLRRLCNIIIMHQPQYNCQRRGEIELWDKLPKHKSLFGTDPSLGLAIGNLTSQIFANYYMNQLDHYIMEELGFNFYGRYVDDIMIVSDDKEKLLKAIPLIVKFAKEKLGVTIHPDKRYLQHYKKGVKFIGGVLKEGRKYIINRTRGSLINKLTHQFKEHHKKLELDFMMTLNSYLGFMSHYDSYNIRKEILTNEKLMKPWLPFINIDTKDYRKITLKNNPESKRITNIVEDMELVNDYEYVWNEAFKKAI